MRIKALVSGFAFCLIPVSANAHTALLGVGSFWSGVAHLLTSADQLVFLLGLAIWTSFQDVRQDARVIGASFLAVLIGVWVGSEVVAAARLNLAPAGAVLMTVPGPAFVAVAGMLLLGLAAAPVFPLSARCATARSTWRRARGRSPATRHTARRSQSY